MVKHNEVLEQVRGGSIRLGRLHLPNLYLSTVMLLIVFLLAIFPFWASGYWVRVLTSAFMYVIITASLNLIVGFAGYPAFGNVVFFGVGAYVAGLAAVYYQLPASLAVFVAGIVAASYALLLGFPILRMRGGYFAIATLGINEATRQIVTNIGVTGGSSGLTMPVVNQSVGIIYAEIYFAMLAIMVICLFTTLWIARNPLGFALRALKDQEEAAEVMGINTTWYKMLAWAISALFMGFAGAVWAFWITFFEPHTAFDIMISVKGFVMILLGGMGTLVGPVIGAFFIEILSEVIWGSFADLHRLFLGTLIILIVILYPQGIAHK